MKTYLFAVAEKGRSVSFLKSTTSRKRKREEVEEVKEEESALKKDKQKYLLDAKRMKLTEQEHL